MANPFLVLGGIAVGIVVATMGVLQVPGWVGSAQDAAALNDLSQASLAQAAAVSTLGTAFGSIEDLNASDLGVTVTPTEGVCTLLAANGSHWLAASKHEARPTWHVRVNGGTIADAGTLAAAAQEAGGLPSGLRLPEEAACDGLGSPSDPGAQPEPEETNPPTPEAPRADRLAYTIRCDAPSRVTLPTTGFSGTVTWSDGLVTTSIVRDVPAGVELQVTMDGSSSGFSTGHLYGDPVRQCFRSMDEWSTSSGLASGTNAFDGMTNLEAVPFSVPRLTDASHMFSGASSFNGDVSKWDVSAVSDLSWAFAGASNFNGDLSRWDVSNVTTLAYAFAGARAFDSDLSEWDVSKVTTLASAFNNAASFTGDVGRWNVSNVTSMESAFAAAVAFNTDIARWDTRNVTKMYAMFNGASSFGGDISSWDVSKVTDVHSYYPFAAGSSLAFAHAPAFH